MSEATKLGWFFLALSTTFFVIFVNQFGFATKFAKGVVSFIQKRLQARRQRIIQRVSGGLWYYAALFKKRADKYDKHCLLRREKRNELEERNYRITLNAARNRRDSAKISAQECWNILQKCDALPIDQATDRPWKDFEDFLQRFEEAIPAMEEETVCA